MYLSETSKVSISALTLFEIISIKKTMSLNISWYPELLFLN